MKPHRLAYELIRHVEPRLLGLRARMLLRKRLGVEARLFAPRPWSELSLKMMVRPGVPADALEYARFKRTQSLPFLFPLGQPPSSEFPSEGERRPTLSDRLDLLARDRCVYFFQQPSPTPIDWHANPLEGKRVRSAWRSWFELADFSPEQGDARVLWEPARAAWAFDLARARTSGHPAGELAAVFWRWVESWMAVSPPFRGFHWKCGQESAVRFIALCFGFWALDDQPDPGAAQAVSRDAERWLTMARLAWSTGYRIFHQMDYARSQKNNHALSESCGLLLISQLFPELREAQRWRETGRRVMEEELARQVYPDGSYVQHSLNYQRVMLQVATLALRLAEMAGEPLSPASYDAVRRAARFLFQLTEASNGRTPLYGNDDGALVLPLSECHFRDFRPAIQAASAVASGERLFEAGPWDEEAAWLVGAQWGQKAERVAEVHRSSAFESGGYYTVRRAESWAMIRCHRYRDRPGHYDPLHVDLWWRGQNVLRDCGSYRYYVSEDPELERYFKSAAAHNVLTLGPGEPIELVSRFLWLPWPRARAKAFAAPGSGEPNSERSSWFSGENLDYDRSPWKVRHRRTVVALADNRWLVIDDLIGRGPQTFTNRWHLPGIPCAHEGGAVRLETAEGPFWLQVLGQKQLAPIRAELLEGARREAGIQGFEARHYSALRPAPTLEVEWRAELPCRVVTAASPHRPVEDILALAAAYGD